jgi:hypothetical protein
MKTAKEIIKDRMRRLNVIYIADLTTLDIVDMMNEYAQEQMKNLNISTPVSQSEQLKCEKCEKFYMICQRKPL